MSRLRRSSDREREQGQGLVEFSLIVPIIILIVISVAELGLAFGNKHTIGYGSREGARVGSALATGKVPDCLGGLDPALVDATLVSAVQRILKSPGSGIDIGNVEEIRIFKADSNGDETAGLVNVWEYTGPGSGPDVDPAEGYGTIDFNLIGSNAWPACARDNTTATPDSIGVTVVYTYDFVTPLPSVVNSIAGGALSLELTETTVMSLNPSI